MGYTEGCVMISMFCASLTTVCNCVVKRVLYQDTEVMGMFEKYIHSHNAYVSKSSSDFVHSTLDLVVCVIIS